MGSRWTRARASSTAIWASIRQDNAFSETLEVEFDEGRMVEYSFKQLEELELAYAITIHKSQGSEYPAVVIPIYSGPRMLMTGT